ncbi:MAG: hypothetical protein BWY83_02470 [bacterium ADurb.Bin478]|nr:MAG: hypothetical protein BWY83_02470 [bacterium ADurb.Bin478]
MTILDNDFLDTVGNGQLQHRRRMGRIGNIHHREASPEWNISILAAHCNRMNIAGEFELSDFHRPGRVRNICNNEPLISRSDRGVAAMDDQIIGRSDPFQRSDLHRHGRVDGLHNAQAGFLISDVKLAVVLGQALHKHRQSDAA